MLNNPDGPNDLIPYFQSLSDKEVTEVSLVCEDPPYLQLVHLSKDKGSCLKMQLKFYQLAFEWAESVRKALR